MRITLCGSVRFKDQFLDWNHKLGLAGHTVYALSVYLKEGEGLSEKEKVVLDLVHLDKILNSDAIVVINIEGYVGFSTAREIKWAQMQGKKVYWVENMESKAQSAFSLL